MALNQLVDSRDIRFVLFEMLELEKFSQNFSEYKEFDRETYDDFLDLAERISVEKIYPASAPGDREGCVYDPATKAVRIPKCYKAPLDIYYETGFIGVTAGSEIGGMGMPHMIGVSCVEIMCAGSLPLLMYPGLSHGAMMVVNNYGTEELKKIYVEKLMTGKWGGTMCLTESEAGSDVGALKTGAVRKSDGSFSIAGQKIFISSGENDYYENMVHLVLARIDGDPHGTKGISLFLVPKYLPKKDGSKGDFNDVVCTGIEHKMGIKGSSTCSLSFGDNGKCTGYLIGEEKKGMRIMFQMMNEARLGVAMQGLSLASTAYMHAVSYAKGRIQGVHVTQLLNPEAKGVPISQQPDVKRMLLWMKSYVEGMRSLSYFLAKNISLIEHSQGEEQEEAKAIVEILIPICKAGNTDTSVLIASEAIQVYGGYGYISEYPVEQFMRDSKITTIYEGTNGIQSIDLTMRKILMNKDQFDYNIFKKKIRETITSSKGIVDDKYIDLIDRGLNKLDEVIEMLKKQMQEAKFMHLFMNATPLQKAMFMLAIGWMHLWSLTVSHPKMKGLTGDTKGAERDKLLQENMEAAYYSGRVLSSQFFLGAEFPKIFGMIDTILFGETAVLKATDDAFTGALKE